MLCKRFEVLIANKKIAIAISGGADSTALLFLLKEKGAQIVALTVDHGLRPESKKEAMDVQNLCLSHNIEHHILILDPLHPNKMHQSLRKARYSLLIQFCKSNDIHTLFLAHHQGDLLETFLMRLWQKSGLLGLSSISSLSKKDDIILARPLLNTPKSQLIDYLKNKSIPYAEDPSNQNTKYLRTHARNLKLSQKENSLFLRLIHAIGKLRNYLETVVLEKFHQNLSWETPVVLKMIPSFSHEPHIIQVIFIEKISRLLGFEGFFRTSTTQNIINALLKKSSTTGYSLYWCTAKETVYISSEKESPKEHYFLELEPIGNQQIPFQIKTLQAKDCIHYKKSPYINFLFSKTKPPLLGIFFEDLIVFFDEVGYNKRRLEEKGWKIKNLSTSEKLISFLPFSVAAQ